MDAIARVAVLFAERGSSRYDGARAESVSALEHALQCAQLAERARAAPSLVAAAFLHDVGHFVASSRDGDVDEVDDEHESRAPLLCDAFAAEVVEPIRLHVQAKRYLVTTDAEYAATLSPASVHSLALQGGPMTTDETRRFEMLPHAREAVALRRWDDLAKVPGRPTPDLAHYLALLDDVRLQATRAPRT